MSVPSGGEFIGRGLIHVIAWWRATPRGSGGYAFSEVEKLEGRWQRRATLIQDAAGEEMDARGHVILDNPADGNSGQGDDRDSRFVEPGDYLRLVPEADEQNDPIGLPNPTDHVNPVALRVMQVDEVTDLRGLTILRRAYV